MATLHAHARADKPGEFLDVYRRYRGLMPLWISACGVPAYDRADVAQEAWLAAHRIFDRHDPSRPFAPWLKAIVRFVAKGYRTASYRPEEVHVKADMPIEHDTDREIDARRILFLAWQGLPERDREVMRMVTFNERSAAAVARALGIPQGTVETRARRARLAVLDMARRLLAIRRH